MAGEPARAVVLPDELSAGDAPAQPLTAQYRLRAELGPRAGATALYLPGLIAHARIRVNGHVLFDTLDRRAQPLPRSAERIQLLRLPDEFDYAQVKALSYEVRQKLARHRPQTLGQAARISGVTPAAISLLLVHLKKGRLRGREDAARADSEPEGAARGEAA